MKTSIPFLCSSLFSCIFAADIIVRTAYQAGKSPVLQVLGLQLDAAPALLGFIISISTMTGVFFKPLFGWLSDRRGKWVWLLLGTAIFAFAPFLYIFVKDTDQLVGLRLFHGMATAIYGPVTMAFVAEIAKGQKTEFYAWFGLSRIAAYIIGPLLGAALLTKISAQHVYLVIGGISLLAFIPMAFLKNTAVVNQSKGRGSSDLMDGLSKVIRNRGIALVAIMDIHSKIAIYAIKAFLPVLMITAGAPILQVGAFLSLQEGANALVRPFAGGIAARFGERKSAALGLALIGVALFWLSWAGVSWSIWGVAVLIGIGQGIFGPSAETLIADMSVPEDMGLTFGAVGALRNAGKITGPILAGFLATYMDLQTVFAVIAVIPLMLAGGLFLSKSAHI